MSDNLPWDNDKPLSISQLLKQSMRSVDTIVSNNSLLDMMSVHLNGLLRQDQEPKVDKAVMLLDSMFANADRAMSSDSDKQVLSILKRQVSSFIGVTLGVKPFLEQQEQQDKNDDDDSDDDDDDDSKPNKLSWSAANEKESRSAWDEKKAYYNEKNADIYGPEHAEHERLRRQQLEEEQYGQDAGSGEEDGSDENDSDEYEEIVEQIQVKSREMGGTPEFQTVRRRQKKKKTATTITTNFSYARPSDSYDNNSAQCNDNNNNKPYYPRHRVRVTEFRPEYLKHLPTDIFCMPVFFPSEESYSIFHSALSSAKKTLYVCVFSLTDNETADVLIDAKKRGIDVKIITDNDQMDERKGSDVLRLHEQFQIPFKKDNSDQFMHNKFAVMDGKTVITGSFNWSAGARYKNRENIIVTNIPSVVEAYTQEFKEIWGSF